MKDEITKKVLMEKKSKKVNKIDDMIPKKLCGLGNLINLYAK